MEEIKTEWSVNLSCAYESANAIELPTPVTLIETARSGNRHSQFQRDCQSMCISSWMSALAVILFVAGLVWTSIAGSRTAQTGGVANSATLNDFTDRGSQQSLLGSSKLKTIPIEQIRVGMRVPAHNPQLSDTDRTEAAFDVDPEAWRTIRLEVAKESGGKLEVTLLRPVDWLVEQVLATELLLAAAETELIDERTWVSKLSAALRLDPMTVIADSTSAIFNNSPVQDIGSLASFSSLPTVIANELGARVSAAAVADVQVTESLSEIRNSLLSGEATGTVVYLDMPELGAQGIATILAIEPCPRITKGPGQIVTATFKHSAADVLDLKFAPSPTSVSSSGLKPQASSLTFGVTASHPFWSVSRQDFIPAGALELGEQVVGIDGQFFRLTSIVPRAGPENVYNFEVAIDHVYFVGEGGVLVHNACDGYAARRISSLGRRANASRELAANLIGQGIKKARNQVAHHLIPIGVSGKKHLRSFFERAAKAGWDVNGAKNGLFMAKGRHASHAAYNAHVENAIMEFMKKHPNATGERARRFLEKTAAELRETLTDSTKHINKLF